MESIEGLRRECTPLTHSLDPPWTYNGSIIFLILILDPKISLISCHVPVCLSGAPSVPKVSCDKREDTSDSLTQKLHWKAPSDDGGDPVIRYTVKYRILRGHIYKGPWRNINVSNTETWYTLKLKWKTTFELTVTAWNKYGESKLDLAHSSCVVEIGTSNYY